MGSSVSLRRIVMFLSFNKLPRIVTSLLLFSCLWLVVLMLQIVEKRDRTAFIRKKSLKSFYHEGFVVSENLKNGDVATIVEINDLGLKRISEHNILPISKNDSLVINYIYQSVSRENHVYYHSELGKLHQTNSKGNQTTNIGKYFDHLKTMTHKCKKLVRLGGLFVCKSISGARDGQKVEKIE